MTLVELVKKGVTDGSIKLEPWQTEILRHALEKKASKTNSIRGVDPWFFDYRGFWRLYEEIYGAKERWERDLGL